VEPVKYFFLALISLLVWLAGSMPVVAGEIYEFYHGVKAQAMGNAVTAIVNDEEALYLNPAGLAGNKEYKFHYLVADMTASSDLVYSAIGGAGGGLDSMMSSPEKMSDLVMGKNIYGEAQLTSTLMMPNMAIGIIGDQQISMTARNRALPKVTLGYQTTNGIQAAYGIVVGRGKKRGELKIGLAAKLLWRRGGYRDLPTTTVMNMSTEKLNQITGPFGRGFGADLGAQYSFKLNNKFSFSSGIVYTDIGDTSFDSGAMAIKGNLAFGLAGKYTYGQSGLTVSYDYRHIRDETDWRKKNHLGLELQLPIMSLYGGVNQVYFTYGAGFDLWLFRITAMSYVEEHGSFVFQNPERRYSLRAALKFNL
jgi:hypothetical protein